MNLAYPNVYVNFFGTLLKSYNFKFTDVKVRHHIHKNFAKIFYIKYNNAYLDKLEHNTFLKMNVDIRGNMMIFEIRFVLHRIVPKGRKLKGGI